MRCSNQYWPRDMSLPRTAPVKTGTEMHVLVTRQALTFSLPLWHHNCDVHGKVCPICQKDAIQDVLLELWPFMQYSGVSLAGATTSIIFVATKVTGVCRDKQNTAFVATKLCLSWQVLSRKNYVCRYKIFLSRQIFAEYNFVEFLSHTFYLFVATKVCL